MNPDCNTLSENVVPTINVIILGLFSVFSEPLVTPQLLKTL